MSGVPGTFETENLHSELWLKLARFCQITSRFNAPLVAWMACITIDSVATQQTQMH